jgi:WD40 repeat protein
VAQTAHASCLLLTSRERPAVLRGLEGSQRPVRALRLLGLSVAAGEQLLAEHELVGSPEERAHLVQAYSGNPLALNIVAQTIADLFSGELAAFLQEDMLIFGSISDLLSEHWGRLSPLEQTLLYWLAILREPVSIEELQAVLVTPLTRMQLLEAVEGLRQRSLLERGQRPGSFTLQSVVLEDVSERLVSTTREELEQGRLRLLREHGLTQAQAKAYVRECQERLLLVPVLASLQSMNQGRGEGEQHVRSLLAEVRSWAEERQGYAPANLVTLLRLLRGDLRGLDLSHLSLRGLSLQGVEMQDSTLAGATLRECTFTQAFDAPWVVAISGSGEYWAAGSMQGKVHVWLRGGQALHLAWQAHTDTIIALAFSPDARTLASASWDGSLKLWEMESGKLLWSGWHQRSVNGLAFAPDGGLLASSGNDALVRLWDPHSGQQVQTLPHPAPVYAITWSPDGRLLASGDFQGAIRLWQMQPTQPATCLQTLRGHTNWVAGLAFAPSGAILASANWDGTVKLWEVGEEGSQRLPQTLEGHTGQVNRVSWSPDGRTLASCGYDKTIWLWDVEQGRYRAALSGHTATVWGLAFTPEGGSLLSGSEDGTLRVWDVASGACVHVLQGYAIRFYDIDWSPDGPSSSPGRGSQLVSGSKDGLVIVWDVTAQRPPRVLGGHSWVAYGVAWSPDGRLVASSGWDGLIRLWDPGSGASVQTLQDPDEPGTLFYSVAWSPDGHLLASGTYQRGVQVWDVRASTRRWVGRLHPIWIYHVAWSPDGALLASTTDDGRVYLWNASDGLPLRQLAGHHHGIVGHIAWSPDGSRLASCAGEEGRGEVFVWDVESGERVRAFVGDPGVIYAVAWDPTGDLLVSGDGDGRLRWWDVHSGECVRMREGHQGRILSLKRSPDGRWLASCGDDGAIRIWDLRSGEPVRTLRRDRPYERLDITGIRGLTEAEIATLRALGAREEARLSL